MQSESVWSANIVSSSVFCRRKLDCAITSMVWTKYSIMNHASIFPRSCCTFCEISLLVRFSRIVSRDVEKKTVVLQLSVGMFEVVIHIAFLLVLIQIHSFRSERKLRL